MTDALRALERLSHDFPSSTSVLQQVERYGDKHWQVAFIGTEERPPVHGRDEDVAWLLRTYPSSLSRQQILSISQSDPLIHSRRVLVASLMWGYGTTGLRYPQRIKAVAVLLSDPALEERLVSCREAVCDGNIERAYMAMTAISGIRSPFFTKFLYFLGRTVAPDADYPLILDTLVAESLAWLIGYRVLVRLNSYWPADDPQSYATYVTTMHRWAQHLGTSADVIEFYLWHPPKQTFREVCTEVHHGAV